MTKKNQHGGKRPGSGRKRRYAVAVESHTLNLPPAFWRILGRLEGSLSSSLAKALKSERTVAELRKTLVEKKQ